MASKFAAVFLVALVGAPALLIYDVLSRLVEQLTAGHERALLIVTGLIGGGIAYRALCWYSDDFWSTAHHELAHACVATLVGGKPARMLVDGASGHLNWSVPPGRLSLGRRFLVLIAPYSFSPISVCVGLLLLVVPHRGNSFLLVASLCAGIGLAAPLSEIHVAQRDLRQGGLITSTICSLWLWTSTVVLLVIELSTRTSAATVAAAYARACSSVAHFVTSMILA